MSKIYIPPIKCQGIKTKLVPLIIANAQLPERGLWIEPFMGSAVVGLNAKPKRALFADLNPHIVAFYNEVKSFKITPDSVRVFLETEGKKLKGIGEEYYYCVRDRFNKNHNSLDFLFLSRSCFNGMIRFNNKGNFNVPFCKKPQRFSQTYISKIVNQIIRFQSALKLYEWSFVCQDFADTIYSATEDDFIYCDPPYLGRHVDYFNSWTINDEQRLFESLRSTKAKFILSTWHSNKYRSNPALKQLWSKFNVVTQEHFYHLGAKEENRNSMLEALVMNFEPYCKKIRKTNLKQPTLLNLST